jgi:N-acyl homoserine lactone hydrolase
MLPIYTVHALRLGTIKADKSESVLGTPRGTMVEVPVWCAAIEGNGQKILVDTGLTDAEKWSQGNQHTIGPDETIDAALAELGWKAKDVDLVVNTHLHYDHCSNNLAFPDAQFFVSRAEWEFASNPSSAQEWAYDLEWTGPDLNYMNYTLIDADDYDVLRGLRVIKTPGHTPGHQSVVVNTAEGLVCIAGDAACMMENLTVPIPTGVFVSRGDALASIKKICRRSDRVFMMHDPELTAFQAFGFPVSPSDWPGTT